MGNRDKGRREAKKPKKKEPKVAPPRRDAGQFTVQNVKPVTDVK
jgi:hypothetical protein